MGKILRAAIGLAIILGGGWYLFSMIGRSPVDQPSLKATAAYKNIAYIIDGQRVQLVNGVAERAAAPGSASRITTSYFGDELHKDLNGDGREDVAFLLIQDGGGSGTFFYVVAALDLADGWVGSHATFIGDRIAPQTIDSGPGSSIIVNYADRKSGEPMTTQPSQAKSLRLLLDPETMQFAELAEVAEKPSGRGGFRTHDAHNEDLEMTAGHVEQRINDHGNGPVEVVLTFK